MIIDLILMATWAVIAYGDYRSNRYRWFGFSMFVEGAVFMMLLVALGNGRTW